VALATADGAVSRWDGASWTAVVLPSGPVATDAVDQIAAAGTGWVATDRRGAIVVADPTPVVAWPVIGALLELDAHVPGLAWAVGTSYGAGAVGSAPRDGSWDLRLDLPPGAGLSGVSLLTESEGWAVGATFAGAQARAELWHLTAAGWGQTSIAPNWGLSSVATIAPDDAWAAGKGVLAQWNGDSWKLVEGAPFGDLTGPLVMVRGRDDPEGWFAARGGLRHLTANMWHSVDLAAALAPSEELAALDGDPTGGVWALAPEHVVRVRADETVQVMPDPPATELRDLSVSPLGAVWLLAEPEGLFRWDPELSVWENHPLGIAGNRVEPLRIQALDQDRDASLPPPEGWEGHDVWIAGTSAIARFRVFRPSYSVFLPNALRD
jgi:hypothetical protein